LDDGTAMEIGFAYSLGKKIYGYTQFPDISLKIKSIGYIDDEIYNGIEDFGHCVNLMLHHSITTIYKSLDVLLQSISLIYN